MINYAVDEDYVGFAEYMLGKRKHSGFPPFMFVAKGEITMKTEATVLRKVREAVKQLQNNEGLLISPPMPAFHERTSRGYTWQIIIRAKSRKALAVVCQGLDSNFRITFDPPGLL